MDEIMLGCSATVVAADVALIKSQNTPHGLVLNEKNRETVTTDDNTDEVSLQLAIYYSHLIMFYITWSSSATRPRNERLSVETTWWSGKCYFQTSHHMMLWFYSSFFQSISAATHSTSITVWRTWSSYTIW